MRSYSDPGCSLSDLPGWMSLLEKNTYSPNFSTLEVLTCVSVSNRIPNRSSSMTWTLCWRLGIPFTPLSPLMLAVAAYSGILIVASHDDSIFCQAQTSRKLATLCPRHGFLDESARWFYFVHWNLMHLKCKYHLLRVPAPCLKGLPIVACRSQSLTHSLTGPSPFCSLLWVSIVRFAFP